MVRVVRKYLYLWLIIPVTTHLTIGSLDIFNRAVYQDPQNSSLYYFITSDLWYVAHFGAALALPLLARRTSALIWTYSFSFAALFLWGMCDFLVGLSIGRPVSLLAPILVMIISIYSLLMCILWNRIEEDAFYVRRVSRETL